MLVSHEEFNITTSGFFISKECTSYGKLHMMMELVTFDSKMSDSKYQLKKNITDSIVIASCTINFCHDNHQAN